MSRGPLRPGMVVRPADGRYPDGVITDLRFQEPGHVPLFDVEWVGGGNAQNQSSTDFIRPELPAPVVAGTFYGDLEVLEVDMTAEVMKVRGLKNWVDVRLMGLPRWFAERADQVRGAWLEADRAKLDWFKPGQIVKGDGALARPATVIEQISESEVKVITSNGIATVPAVELQLHSQSVIDLQVKEAQKREQALAAFKQEVLEKALEAKEEHDLCSEVDKFLSDLGIKVPVRKVRAVMHLTVEVEAVITQGTGMTRLDLESGSNRDWWRNTLRFTDSGEELHITEDDDVADDSIEIRLIEQTVTEIHDESYTEGE